MTTDVPSCSNTWGAWFDSVNVSSSILNIIKIIDE